MDWLEQPVHIICREGRPEDLVADLARHDLDMVLTDAPISPGLKIKAFNHLLGDSGITVFGTAALARTHRRSSPPLSMARLSCCRPQPRSYASSSGPR